MSNFSATERAGVPSTPGQVLERHSSSAAVSLSSASSLVRFGGLPGASASPAGALPRADFSVTEFLPGSPHLLHAQRGPLSRPASGTAASAKSPSSATNSTTSSAASNGSFSEYNIAAARAVPDSLARAGAAADAPAAAGSPPPGAALNIFGPSSAAAPLFSTGAEDHRIVFPRRKPADVVSVQSTTPKSIVTKVTKKPKEVLFPRRIAITGVAPASHDSEGGLGMSPDETRRFLQLSRQLSLANRRFRSVLCLSFFSFLAVSIMLSLTIFTMTSQKIATFSGIIDIIQYYTPPPTIFTSTMNFDRLRVNSYSQLLGQVVIGDPAAPATMDVNAASTWYEAAVFEGNVSFSQFVAFPTGVLLPNGATLAATGAAPGALRLDAGSSTGLLLTSTASGGAGSSMLSMSSTGLVSLVGSSAVSVSSTQQPVTLSSASNAVRIQSGGGSGVSIAAGASTLFNLDATSGSASLSGAASFSVSAMGNVGLQSSTGTVVLSAAGLNLISGGGSGDVSVSAGRVLFSSSAAVQATGDLHLQPGISNVLYLADSGGSVSIGASGSGSHSVLVNFDSSSFLGSHMLLGPAAGSSSPTSSNYSIVAANAGTSLLVSAGANIYIDPGSGHSLMLGPSSGSTVVVGSAGGGSTVSVVSSSLVLGSSSTGCSIVLPTAAAGVAGKNLSVTAMSASGAAAGNLVLMGGASTLAGGGGNVYMDGGSPGGSVVIGKSSLQTELFGGGAASVSVSAGAVSIGGSSLSLGDAASAFSLTRPVAAAPATNGTATAFYGQSSTVAGSGGGNLVLDAGTGNAANGLVLVGTNNADAVVIGRSGTTGTFVRSSVLSLGDPSLSPATVTLTVSSNAAATAVSTLLVSGAGVVSGSLSSSCAGGDVVVSAGSGWNNGTGGNLYLTGGAAGSLNNTNATRVPGNVYVGSTTGTTSVVIASSSGTWLRGSSVVLGESDGSPLTISRPTSQTGVNGANTTFSGQNALLTQTGGNLVLAAGGSQTGNGGNILLRAGLSSTSAKFGSIYVGDTSSTRTVAISAASTVSLSASSVSVNAALLVNGILSTTAAISAIGGVSFGGASPLKFGYLRVGSVNWVTRSNGAVTLPHGVTSVLPLDQCLISIMYGFRSVAPNLNWPAPGTVQVFGQQNAYYSSATNPNYPDANVAFVVDATNVKIIYSDSLDTFLTTSTGVELYIVFVFLDGALP